MQLTLNNCNVMLFLCWADWSCCCGCFCVGLTGHVVVVVFVLG